MLFVAKYPISGKLLHGAERLFQSIDDSSMNNGDSTNLRPQMGIYHKFPIIHIAMIDKLKSITTGQACL